MDASKDLGILPRFAFSPRVTLVTQLTSRELVLEEKRVFVIKQLYLKESYCLRQYPQLNKNRLRHKQMCFGLDCVEFSLFLQMLF